MTDSPNHTELQARSPIERAAAAIYERGRRAQLEWFPTWAYPSWDEADQPIRAVYLDMARLAAEAFREPTEAMEDSIWHGHVLIYVPTDLTQVIDCIDFKAAWRAMLDALVKDTPT